MIWGPYDENGELWDCDDHDICNGAFIDGNYVYLSTIRFPYVLGCFGPGPTQAHQASCTSGGCGGDSGSGSSGSGSSGSGSSGSNSSNEGDASTDDAATAMTTLTAISTALIALLYF